MSQLFWNLVVKPETGALNFFVLIFLDVLGLDWVCEHSPNRSISLSKEGRDEGKKQNPMKRIKAFRVASFVDSFISRHKRLFNLFLSAERLNELNTNPHKLSSRTWFKDPTAIVDAAWLCLDCPLTYFLHSFSASRT